MKYDLNEHSLIEENGDPIASFNLCVPAGRAFKILDDLNNAKSCQDLERNLDVVSDDYKSLEKDNEGLEDKIIDLKTEVEALDDRLQGIITMLESEYEFKTMEEMAEEIINICAAPI